MAVNEAFNNMIDEAVYLLKIRQKELARLLNISPSYLSGIKKGEKTASSELIEKISVIITEAKGEKMDSFTYHNEDSTMKQRMIDFLAYIDKSQGEFEKSVGIANGWTNKIGDSIRETTLSKIKEVYPELNIAWLKTGIGSMLISGGNEVTLETPEEESQEITAKFVPLLPIAAQGGSLNDFVVSVKDSDCEKVVSPMKGAQFAMPVNGDSMAPEYPNGSQIFIKKINEKAFIEWGKAYVLDTCNGTVIKILVPSEKDGYVRCLSINKDPIFAPFEISWHDVYGVYRVLLCMSVK